MGKIKISGRNANTSFLPVYYLCWILGTMPLTRHKGTNIYQPSRWAFAYICVWIVLSIASCYEVVDFFNDNLMILNTTHHVPPYLEPVSTCIIRSVINGNILLKAAQLANFFKELCDFDKSAISVPVQIHYKSFHVNLLISIAYPLLYIVIRLIRDFHQETNQKNTLTFLFVDLSHLSTISLEAQFISLCYYLKQRYHLINIKLQHMRFAGKLKKLEENSQGCQWLKDQVRVLESQLPNTLEQLRKAHIHLCEITQQLNDTYGPQLFFVVMLSFIQIPTNMYTIAEGKESTNYDIALAIWSTSFILRLFITLKICSSTVSEASRTSVIVESMKYRVLHPDIMEELTIFSTHMANEQVKFTSCGLFNMDMPVLISVLAAGLTYLAIMVQM